MREKDIHCSIHSNIGTDNMLYSEEDLEKSMEKIEVIDFHEVMGYWLIYKAIFVAFIQNAFKQKEVNGVKFWCYVAGHVLGAAMFMIEIAGVKVGFVKFTFLMALMNNFTKGALHWRFFTS